MSVTPLPEVTLITDGACKGNPGPGGWGALLRSGDKERELYGGEPQTTNNRMELRAVIEGLSVLKKPCRVCIVTDSQYVKNGVESWMANWKRRGWRTAAGSPVANQDLWQALDLAMAPHSLRWEWVKGHSGHPDNERADRLANLGVVRVAQ